MPRHPATITAEDRKLLARSNLFRALTPAVKAELIRAAEAVTIPVDTVLWRRGGRPSYVYIVLSGRIGLFEALGDEGTAVIDLFPPGSVIAGGQILKKIPYAYSGKTVDVVRAVRIPARHYRRLVLSDHSLLYGTALDMDDQWRRLTAAIRDLKQLSANQRLGCYLLALTNRRKGGVVVRLTEDLALMARILGVTRESLSRSFAQLRPHGVSKRAKLVTIEDVRVLRVYCELAPHSDTRHRYG